MDCIYGMMEAILSQSKISYIKWDMNRSITECYSAALPADRQGEVFHRYILGVYDLYERLTSAFPYVPVSYTHLDVYKRQTSYQT